MNDRQQIEVSIEDLNEALALGDAVLRLRKNRDFRKLITDGYFTQNAARLVALKSDPSIVGTPTEDLIDREIIGIGTLQQYLRETLTKAGIAEKTKEDHTAELARIDAEGE